MATWRLDETGVFSRPMGDSEYCFYSVSAEGHGDMFLHIGFDAEVSLLTSSRVAVAWATLRARHPLLAARVQPGEKGATFLYSRPADVDAAIAAAEAALSFSHASRDELIAMFMDGPRSLSDDHQSHLTLSTTPGSTSATRARFDLLMCAPHYTGDAMSLHQSTQELMSILASDKTDVQLRTDLEDTLAIDAQVYLADLAEDQLPPFPLNAWHRAATAVNYLQTQRKEIGGYTLPREQRGERRTLLLRRALEPAETRAVLARCKRLGVSVNHALFALVNLSWTRLMSPNTDRTLPMMMYTALNLRPYLQPADRAASYWFLALGYFNIVLPAFPPMSRPAFWARARAVKAQMAAVVSSPFLPARTRLAAAQRGARARVTPAATSGAPPAGALDALMPGPSVPSAALMGLSLVGNLDGVYRPTAGGYAGRIVLDTVTTASRLKPGGVLLFAHTFGGRLWTHMCYDAHGFAEGRMEDFWAELGKVVREFLVEGDE